MARSVALSRGYIFLQYREIMLKPRNIFLFGLLAVIQSPAYSYTSCDNKAYSDHVAKKNTHYKNNLELAKQYLLESVNVKSSPVLSTFGPDTSLVREIYARGEKSATLEFLARAEKFWNSVDGNYDYIAMWRKMINNDCALQFFFYDTTHFSQLELE